MEIGIIKEQYFSETRVPLIPRAVHELVADGHPVTIQSEAGSLAGFSDELYRQAGARVVYSAQEVISRSRMVLKIYPPSLEEIDHLEDEQIFLSFLHLTLARRPALEHLIAKTISAIGYEAIEDEKGDLPVLAAMSEITGQLILSIAAYYLQTRQGGKGILLGGIPGVPPGTVVILGAGVVGRTAARTAVGLGANVILLDREVGRLRSVSEQLNYRIVTALAEPHNIERFVPVADVLIGAVLIRSESAPHLISEDLVMKMKPGTVLLDISIDQGGCCQTSRPTNLTDPVFVKHKVIHFCVPNIPALVPRTATYALSNMLLPYIRLIAEQGIDPAIKVNPGFAKGVYTHRGVCWNQKIAQALGLPSPISLRDYSVATLKTTSPQADKSSL